LLCGHSGHSLLLVRVLYGSECGHSLLLVKVTAAIHFWLAKVNGHIHFRKHRRYYMLVQTMRASHPWNLLLWSPTNLVQPHSCSSPTHG